MGIYFEEEAGPIVWDVEPKSGADAGGTSITVTGEGFDNNMEAGFGSNFIGIFGTCTTSPCTFQTPPGTGSVPVTLGYNPTGVNAVFPVSDQTGDATFTYLALPAGFMQPSSGPPTGGTNVTIDGRNFSTTPGATTVNFNFNGVLTPAPNLQCTSTTVCTMTTPPLSPAGDGPATIPVTMTLNSASYPLGGFTFKLPPGPPHKTTCADCDANGQRCMIKNGVVTCVGTIR